MNAPRAFADWMIRWLGPEWDDLASALEQPPLRAVRLHRVDVQPARHAGPAAADGAGPLAAAVTLPVPEGVRRELGDPVPWADGGYYIAPDSPLGRLIYHDMGLYYLQEPSAMAAVTALAPQPGEWVLDLCAAPGGKTTAIGRALGGHGWLAANEIHPGRVEVLAQNLERTGLEATIFQETPERLADALGPCFDAVLVDAPCSGEGMFRKDPAAIAEWSPDAPARCADRQRDILRHALRLVRPGGRLVYSTCTFNPVENEQVIAWALQHHPVEVLPLPEWPGWTPGQPDWANGDPRLLHTRRLWPHRGMGEGHFVAALQVLHTPAADRSARAAVRGRGQPPSKVRLEGWWDDLLSVPVPESWRRPLWRGDFAYTWPPRPLPDGLRVLRPGVPIARMLRDRMEPLHALAMALAPGAARRSLSLGEADAARYLAGEALADTGEKGWVWVHVDGLPLGWGKRAAGRVNNLYPKGLRRPRVIG